ncbi:chemotaxis protein CheW [Vibrio maerlii]|uniref:chemotaxis protein CheW n=1 Tax=Vibrio maerlii TaxID=2231648 RepID=UPI0030B88A8F
MPNLDDVQRLLNQMESTNVVAELEVESVMEQNTLDITVNTESTLQLEAEMIVDVVTPVEEIQEWVVESPADEFEPITEVAEPETEPVQEISVELETQTQAAGGDEELWHSTERVEEFQVLYFDVNGVTFAVPLDELGGIHKLGELSHLIGRPDWYLGLQTQRENQMDVVDTAKWVMADKLADEEYKQDYDYIVMLGESQWGLASSQLKGTETLSNAMVRWRNVAGKRPWLAGMVTEKMCALIHVKAMVGMLNAGMDIKAYT